VGHLHDAKDIALSASYRACAEFFPDACLQGRFLALAGFGNLPGDIVFFDRKLDGRCKQMGAVR
jgi:hypothetical protein